MEDHRYAKVDEASLRMQCLNLANGHGISKDSDEVVARASAYYAFVVGGNEIISSDSISQCQQQNAQPA
jgi:hypothetical protein